MHSTLIDAQTLAQRPADADWVLVDCRFRLADTAAGEATWREATIPGAVYAHLDRDLSGPIVPGKTGRHPLPTAEALAATLSGLGIGSDTQVVAFDDVGGAFASRLWWMLRWLGHDAVAVLDGGLPAWIESGHDTAPGVPAQSSRTFVPSVREGVQVDAAAVAAALDRDDVVVMDARAADRFRGENEHTDPIAGHIAGAVSVPFGGNLDPAKRMRDTAALRTRFDEVLGGRRADAAICYCGSGVTACHDILAMVHAGLDEPRLYAGSWSEWITDPSRPREPA